MINKIMINLTIENNIIILKTIMIIIKKKAEVGLDRDIDNKMKNSKENSLIILITDISIKEIKVIEVFK